MSSSFEMIGAAVGALSGGAGAPLLTRYAAQRVTRRRPGADIAAERSVLGAVLADPTNFSFVDVMLAKDFFHPEHAALWTLIVEELDDPLVVAARSVQSKRELKAVVREHAVTSRRERAATLKELVAGEKRKQMKPRAMKLALAARNERLGEAADLARKASELFVEAADLVELGTREALDKRALMKHGGSVVSAAADRGALGGSAVVTETGDFDVPLRRDYAAPSPLSTVVVGVALALALGVAPFLIGALGLGLAASVLALGALWVVAFSGAIIALVDLATMYLDTGVFWSAAGLSWALALLAALASHDPKRLLAGLVVVSATAFMFEGLNFLYKLVRGTDGMGFGDTMILVMTAGVPGALSGSWSLGMYCVTTGLAVGVGGWLVHFVRGLVGLGPRFTRTTPFAFGPYLEVGWVIAWVWALYVSLPGLHG